MNIQELITESYGTALEKGWHDSEEDGIAAKLLLIHAEVSEAAEAYRDGDDGEWVTISGEHDGKPEGLVVELADVIIRIADLAGAVGMPLEYALEQKLLYNKSRPHRHGGKKI